MSIPPDPAATLRALQASLEAELTARVAQYEEDLVDIDGLLAEKTSAAKAVENVDRLCALFEAEHSVAARELGGQLRGHGAP